MNKKLIALAVGAAMGVAPMAASAAKVTVYGHAQVEVHNTEVTVTLPTSLGGGSASADGNFLTDNARGRLGVKASEKLGNGMTAIAKFEWKIDTTLGGRDDPGSEQLAVQVNVLSLHCAPVIQLRHERATGIVEILRGDTAGRLDHPLAQSIVAVGPEDGVLVGGWVTGNEYDPVGGTDQTVVGVVDIDPPGPVGVNPVGRIAFGGARSGFLYRIPTAGTVRREAGCRAIPDRGGSARADRSTRGGQRAHA